MAVAGPWLVMTSQATDEPIIELRDVTAGYEGRPALRSVSLSIRRGEFIGIWRFIGDGVQPHQNHTGTFGRES
mgnify:CR=1 FL=1